MTLYAIEILGRPVMAFPAEDDLEADGFALSRSTEEDLLVLHHNGAPLWDGKSERFVRRAHPEEQAQWETAFARALEAGDADEWDRDEWTIFLVPVVDPTDDGSLDDEDDE